MERKENVHPELISAPHCTCYCCLCGPDLRSRRAARNRRGTTVGYSLLAGALAGSLLAVLTPGCAGAGQRSTASNATDQRLTEAAPAATAAENSAEIDSGLDSMIADYAETVQQYLSDSPDTATQTPTTPPTGAGLSAEVLWNPGRGSPPASAPEPEVVKSIAASDSLPEIPVDATLQDDEAAIESPAIDRAPRPMTLLEMLAESRRQYLGLLEQSSFPLREAIASLMLETLASAGEEADARRIDSYLAGPESVVLGAYRSHFREVNALLQREAPVEEIVASAVRLSEALSATAPFQVADFRLCLSVSSFGNFEETPLYTWEAGRSRVLIAYVELDRFTSTLASDGRYRTKLTQQFDLYTDADGALVYSEPPLAVEDLCTRKRRDFFVVRYITLPGDLSLGKYNLKVTIRDDQSGSVAEATLPLTIVASATGG